jgi:hypothetical protein
MSVFCYIATEQHIRFKIVQKPKESSVWATVRSKKEDASQSRGYRRRTDGGYYWLRSNMGRYGGFRKCRVAFGDFLRGFFHMCRFCCRGCYCHSPVWAVVFSSDLIIMFFKKYSRGRWQRMVFGWLPLRPWYCTWWRLTAGWGSADTMEKVFQKKAG